MTEPAEPYSDWIGKTYQELQQDSHFLILVDGSKPEIVDDSLDDFYISSEASKTEFIFKRESQRLIALIFWMRPDGRFPKSLNAGMTRQDVHALLGEPIESVPARKIPVLGEVPPFERFEGKVSVTYSLKTDQVEDVRFHS
ncbi:hypothetical protein L2750_04690 [Shewanella submarina]|uniref:Uncharacterized protein n=1 Tax=Shewanella submarina TaxID=2016376 RepID=A0ABV7GK42_9GAMM|nr:hypothetical protein [Shewanella submarina]MCL1036448.1 hypothetical protein [Shewanella submarina]